MNEKDMKGKVNKRYGKPITHLKDRNVKTQF